MNHIPLSDEDEEGELPEIYEREDRDDCMFDLEDPEDWAGMLIEVDLEDDIGECEGES